MRHLDDVEYQRYKEWLRDTSSIIPLGPIQEFLREARDREKYGLSIPADFTGIVKYINGKAYSIEWDAKELGE